MLQGRLEKENTYEMRLNRDKLKTIQKNDGKYTKTFIRPIDFLKIQPYVKFKFLQDELIKLERWHQK